MTTSLPPLAGTRVVDFGSWYAGPGAAKLLQSMGAEVIKVEDSRRPDPLRRMKWFCGTRISFTDAPAADEYQNILYGYANGGKARIDVDLGTSDGREVLHELVRGADVFITNFRKPYLTAVGLDTDSCRATVDALIYCHVSAFGSDGPESDARAFDPIAMARSGFMYHVGTGEEPASFVFGMADQATATTAALAVTAALVGQHHQPEFRYVEVSMIGALIHLQGLAFQVGWGTGRPVAPQAPATAFSPLTNWYQCADGEWLMIGETDVEAAWPLLCVALEREEWIADARFATLPARLDNNRVLNDGISEIFFNHPRDHWLVVLRRVGLSVSPVQRAMEVADDPQVVANGYSVMGSYPPPLDAGRAVGTPVSWGPSGEDLRTQEFRIKANEPALILEHFGVSSQNARALVESGVVSSREANVGGDRL